MKKLWLILVGILSVTGLMTILAAVSLAVALMRMTEAATPTLPDRIVLDLDLDAGVIDEPPAHDPLSLLAKNAGPMRLSEIAWALDAARSDPRVQGLNIRLGASDLNLANAQEIRDAILNFRKSGKFVQAFADSFGEMGGGTIDAYVASAADEVWLQPSGDMGLTGFSAEVPFLKGTLDLLGVNAQFQRRHEYKGAVETFTEKTMSGPARQDLSSLLDSFLGQVVSGIAEGRRLSPDAVRYLIDRAPFGAREALNAKLIDRLGYEDEAQSALDEKFPGGERVDAIDYLKAVGSPYAKGEHKIAVIHAVGPVVSGQSGQSLDGAKTIAADDIVGALNDAADDGQVAAIVLRIDSPGGSYLASDAIWRAVATARGAGKPVIASIGEMAASGGYFIAMGADRIVAEPGAITGSIGVFAGKMVMRDFLAKLGISFDAVDAGANAGLLSMSRAFTPEQAAKMSRMLDRIYADFTAKAGEGRHMEMDAIDKVARGRIFTGEQGLKAGLVDELGGFDAAIAAARQAAKLPPEASVRLVYLPTPLSALERLAALLESGDIPLGMESMARLSQRIEAIAQDLGLAQSRGQVRMAPVRIRN